MALSANTPAAQSLFQSGWFVVGLLTQTLVVHLLRTPRIPFVQSRASATLLAMTAAIVVAGVWLPMGPLASHFRLQALPAAYFGWLGLILLALELITAATQPMMHAAGIKVLFSSLTGDVLLDTLIGAVFAMVTYSSLAAVLLALLLCACIWASALWERLT